MRELKEQRSVTEKVYLLSDGSFEREIHSTPINYFDEVTGDLEPIDSTLEPTQTPSGRAWKNRGNSFKISLPDVLGDNWVSVETSVSRVAFKPATRFLPEVAIANSAQSQGRSPAPNRRAYDNAFDGAVLDYVSTPYGLKETIELPRFNGANVFSFDMVVDGVVPTMTADGAVEFHSTESTTVIGRLAKPWMEDSALDAEGVGVRSYDVHYELSPSLAGFRLDVVAERKWLTDPARVWPVRIDPTYEDMEYRRVTEDAYVSDANPSTNYDGQAELKAGYSGGANHRAYIKNWDGSGFLSGAAKDEFVLLDADLKVFCSARSGSSSTIYIGRIDESWTSSSLTWNNKPWHTVMDDEQNVTAGSWANFQVFEEVEDWFLGNRTKYGFALWGSANSYASFRAWEYDLDAPGGAYAPYLRVRYAARPYVRVTSPSTDTPSFGRPVLRWLYSDNTEHWTTEGGTQHILSPKTQEQYQIEVVEDDIDSTSKWTRLGSGAATSCALFPPTGWTFSPGRYFVRMRAAGDTLDAAHPLAWSAWTAWQPFYVADSQSPISDGAGIEAHRASIPVAGGLSVDAATGKLTGARTDFAAPGLGPAPTIGLSYDSSSSVDVGFGPGWYQTRARLQNSSLGTVTSDSPLTDPGFEALASGVAPSGDPWTVNDKTKVTYSSAAAKSGAKSLRFYRTGSYGTNYAASTAGTTSAMHQVAPGQRVTASAWAKTLAYSVDRDIATSGQYGALVKTLFYDASGGLLGYARSNSLTKSETSWMKLSVDTTAPAGARFAYLTVQSACASGTVYFDDVELSTHTIALTDADGTKRTFEAADNGDYQRDAYAPGMKVSLDDASTGSRYAGWRGGTELAPNEGFEYVPASSSWYESDPNVTEQVTTAAHTGSRSMRFDAASYVSEHISTDPPGGPYGAPITGNQEVRASAWINTEDLQVSGSSNVGVALKMYYYNSTNNYTYGSHVGSFTATYDTNGWRRIDVVGTPPSGANRVKLNVEYVNARGTVYVDDVSMSQGAVTEGDATNGIRDGRADDFDSCWVDAGGSRYLQYELPKTVRASAIDLALFDAEEGVQISSSGYGLAPGYKYRVRVATDSANFASGPTSTVAEVSSYWAFGLQRLRFAQDEQFRYIRVEALGATHGDELRIAEIDVPMVKLGDSYATFGSTGRIEAVADIDGNWTDYAWSGSTLTTITDAAGRRLAFDGVAKRWSYSGRDSSGQTEYTPDVVSYASDPASFTSGPGTFTVSVDSTLVAAYGYNDKGRIARVADADGVGTDIGYDDQGRVITITTGSETASPTVTTLAYGTVSASVGKVTISTGQGVGTLTREVHFDRTRGCQVSKTLASGQSQTPSTTVSFDEYHHVSQVNDPTGHTTYMTRDGHGNVLNTAEASGTTYARYSRADYANDRVTKSVDAKGNVSTYRYDDTWRLLVSSVAVSDVEGGATTAQASTYDEWGNRITGEIANSTASSILENGNMQDDPFATGGGWRPSTGTVKWGTNAAQPELGKMLVVDYVESSFQNPDQVPSVAYTYAEAAGFIHANNTYAISAWLLGTGEVAVKCYSDDAGNDAIGNSFPVIEVADTTAETKLRPRSGTFVAPAGTRSVRIFARSYDGALLVDNVTLERANAAGTANFVANGSMEKSDEDASDEHPLDWSHPVEGPTFTYASGEAVEGGRSLSIAAAGTDDGRWWSDPVPMSNSVTLTISAWVKTVGVGTAGAKVYARFLDANGNTLSSGEASITPVDKTISGTTDWTRYVRGVKVPPASTQIKIALEHRGGGGTAYFDSVCVEPMQSVTSTGYDSATHTFAVEETTLAGHRISSAYDARGRLLTSSIATDAASAPRVVIENDYDQAGRLSRVTQAPASDLGITAAYGYTAAGRLSSVTNPNGGQTSLAYDGAGRLKSVTTPGGYVASTDYDGLGRAWRTYRPSLPTSAAPVPLTETSFDDLGRADRTVSFDASGLPVATTSVDYDLEGRVATTTIEGTGVAGTSSASFDILDRPRTTRTSGPSGVVSTILTHDSADNLTRLDWVSPIGTDAVVNTYAKTNQWASTKAEDSGTTWKFTFAGSGVLTTIMSPLGTRDFGFDTAHRLTDVRTTVPNAAGASKLFTAYSVSHDGADRITSVVTNANGTSDDAADVFGYDAADRLTSWTRTGAGAASASYGYDRNGNMTSTVVGGVVTTMAYDTDDRITTKASSGTTTTYTHDELGRLKSEVSSGSVAATRTYSYDALGRMSAVEESGTRATYAYGPTGMREIKQLASAAGTTTVTDAWVGMGLMAERVVTPTSTTEYRYVYGPDSLPVELLVKKESGAWVSYAIHCDAGGSVTGISDEDGNTVARYAYDPWGNPIEDATHATDALVAAQPLRYRGYYWDAETSHYYLPARYYDPELGRFLSVDPAPPSAGEPMSLNRYVYCEDNPVMADDPNGLRPDYDGDGKISSGEAAIYASTQTKNPVSKKYLYSKGMSDWYLEQARKAEAQKAFREAVERGRLYAEELARMRTLLASLHQARAGELVAGVCLMDAGLGLAAAGGIIAVKGGVVAIITSPTVGGAVAGLAVVAAGGLMIGVGRVVSGVGEDLVTRSVTRTNEPLTLIQAHEQAMRGDHVGAAATLLDPMPGFLRE